MDVKELVEILGSYPPHADVKVTWEGIFRDLEPKNIYQAPTGKVIIDADENMYKEEILSGEKKV